jgi:drug/metabolite transporter (DMT)-like permease
VYSVLLRKNSADLDPIFLTRRTLFWGIVTALPMALAEGVPYPAACLLQPVIAGNFLFLGLIGSGLCYVFWNRAIQILGVVTTNNFIYLNPFVTIVTAFLFLSEPISPLALLGAVLITAGVVAAQGRPSLPPSAQ